MKEMIGTNKEKEPGTIERIPFFSFFLVILYFLKLKSILHQNANPLALGSRLRLDPPNTSISCYPYQHVGIQEASQTQAEASWTQREVLRTQCEPQRKPVEYSLRWICEGWPGLGHVDLRLFVSFLFALGTQPEHSFWWNTGLTLIK